MFDKSNTRFPAKNKAIFFGHCAISPLYKSAADTIKVFTDDMATRGIRALADYLDVMSSFHISCGSFLRTDPANISFVHNTAEAMCQIANGYPFQAGDQVISYLHEYPSNHYPWVLQKRRGVELLLLPDSDPVGNYGDITSPKGWSLEHLEDMITKKTRIVALSHVQFTSGYAADVAALGPFCHERGIDLIVDCAQSLGCLPVYPEEYKLSAVASSGWKWMMGPKGSGILYTSEQLREKLDITMAGPSLMQQGLDYLNLAWDPHKDGRMFEYSTLPWDHVAALNTIMNEVFLCHSAEEIRAEIFRLQDLFIEHLEPDLLRFFLFPEKHRSGIMAALPKSDVQSLVKKMGAAGLIVTAPVGYLRFAPHFYLDDKQIEKAAHIVNSICHEG